MRPIVTIIGTNSGLRAGIEAISSRYRGVATHRHEYLWVRRLYAEINEDGYLGLGKEE